jgi:Arc/MetJ-type ribon-helix-helix transcriptional regulator
VTTRVALRLPDDLIAAIDRLVSEGRAPSRAAFIARALRREQRREEAAGDVDVLTSAASQDDDLDALASYGAGIDRTELD